MDKIQYLKLTPAGAYYLCQNGSDEVIKSVLKKIVDQPLTPELSYEFLTELFGKSCLAKLDNVIKQFQRKKLIQVIANQQTIPTNNFEQNLAALLNDFSQNNRTLLSDSQGFCLLNNGFPEALTEEISVLSADIAAMHARRATGINNILKLGSQAWSIVDAGGNSCLGFWPLMINKEVFVLAIEGKPYFNQAAFTDLIWLLYLKYGQI